MIRRDQSTINRDIRHWARFEATKKLIENHKEEFDSLIEYLKYKHPKDKYKLLQPNKRKEGETKEIIMAFLKDNPNSTITQIQKVVKICQPQISMHLKDLENKKLIKHEKLKVRGGTKIWSLI